MTEGHSTAALTSIGTGTTKTRLNGDKPVKMPKPARTLIGLKLATLGEVMTAAEHVLIKAEVDSDDVKLKPYEVLAPVIGASKGAGGMTISSPVEFWPIWAELHGGEDINVYGTALVANTSAQYLAAELIYSDEPLWKLKSQLKAKMGTLTAMEAATAGVSTGTAYSISGCHRLRELYGVHVPTTVAASKGFAGFIDFVSSEFKSSFPQQLRLPSIHGALDVDGAGTASNTQAVTQIGREKTDMGIEPEGTTITDTYKLELAVTTAGKFISGILAEIQKSA